MTLWQLALFVAASLLALRSFVTLANHHQQFTLRRLLRERQENLQKQTTEATATKAA